MTRGFWAAALAVAGLAAPAARADGGYPYHGRTNYALDGFIRGVDTLRGRVTVDGDQGGLYTVDTFGTDIILRASDSVTDREGATGDLARGMHVHVVGTLVGQSLVEADRLRVLPVAEARPAVVTVSASAPAPEMPAITLDGIVRAADADRDRVTIINADDKRFTLDTFQSDIILPGVDRSGKTADLVRGMRVHIIGSLLPQDVIVADRVRVLPDVADAPVPPPAPKPPVESLDSYTGILIDCRDIDVLRSPAPEVYGAGADLPRLYPDRAHVPTPDEVQEESVVRYYRTLDAAEAGVSGAHPLILRAVSVVGPARDGVQLTDEGAALFQALDKRLHYSRTWKVGFLIPADR